MILALLIFVADFAIVVGLEEDDLAQSFICINLCRQRSGVADLESHETFPLRLERCDVDDDAAARVGGFTDADGQHVARNLEVLHGAGERERVRRNNAMFSVHSDETAFIEVLGVHNGVLHVGEDLVFIGNAEVVSVTGEAVRDDAFAHLLVIEWADHVMFK